jgi:hypothetical protein
MCPEYARKKFEGTPCPYIAAFDVFSIGVVMVGADFGMPDGWARRHGMGSNSRMRFVDTLKMKMTNGSSMDGNCSTVKRIPPLSGIQSHLNWFARLQSSAWPLHRKAG